MKAIFHTAFHHYKLEVNNKFKIGQIQLPKGKVRVKSRVLPTQNIVSQILYKGLILVT